MLTAVNPRASLWQDRVFAKFSKSLGIASVREYEEKTLRVAREREAELLKLKQEQGKVGAPTEACRPPPSRPPCLLCSLPPLCCR